MANEEHVKLLLESGNDWNRWRGERPQLQPDLHGAELSNQVFSHLNLEDANLSNAKLRDSFFVECQLDRAILTRAEAAGCKFHGCNLQAVHAQGLNFWGGRFHKCQLDNGHFELDSADQSEGSNVVCTAYGVESRPRGTCADFTEAGFFDCSAKSAAFDYARLQEVRAIKTSFAGSSFRGATLTPRQVVEVSLNNANMRGANLCGADLAGVDLCGANLQGAALIDARLGLGRMTQMTNVTTGPEGTRWNNITHHELLTDLRGVNLRGADLTGASLLQADLTDADLRGARVYGTSTWNVKLDGAKQDGLIVSPQGTPDLTVDNLEIAQFVYLLLDNPRIRDVIDKITSKVVLILGRFTEERKRVLDAIREHLRTRNWCPVMFDFEKPASRGVLETVSTLAHMARFVIADYSDPKMVLAEVPWIANSVTVPILPIMHAYAGDEHVTLGELRRGRINILDTRRYTDIPNLLESLAEWTTEADSMAGKLGDKAM